MRGAGQGDEVEGREGGAGREGAAAGEGGGRGGREDDDGGVRRRFLFSSPLSFFFAFSLSTRPGEEAPHFCKKEDHIVHAHTHWLQSRVHGSYMKSAIRRSVSLAAASAPRAPALEASALEPAAPALAAAASAASSYQVEE